jgi:hypothetical protein
LPACAAARVSGTESITGSPSTTNHRAKKERRELPRAFLQKTPLGFPRYFVVGM